MKLSLKRSVFAGSLLVLLAQTGAFAADAPDDGAAASANAEAKKAPLTYIQLRSGLMDFADRYMQMIGQAADTLQKKAADPDARAGIHSIKLFPCSAAFNIAVDSNPHMALLDMIVLVHLQGTVWKENIPKRFGENAALLLDAQKDLEEDIDGIALRVMSQEEFKQITDLVEEWHKEHPNQRYVSYIRFADFAGMRREGGRPGRGGPNLLSIGGLLSAFQLVNVDEASRSMDQARMVAERALYLSERMPTMIRWQTEMFYYEMAASPETKSILATGKSLQTLPERLTVGLLIVALAVFLLALLYRFLSLKIK